MDPMDEMGRKDEKDLKDQNDQKDPWDRRAGLGAMVFEYVDGFSWTFLGFAVGVESSATGGGAGSKASETPSTRSGLEGVRDAFCP